MSHGNPKTRYRRDLAPLLYVASLRIQLQELLEHNTAARGLAVQLSPWANLFVFEPTSSGAQGRGYHVFCHRRHFRLRYQQRSPGQVERSKDFWTFSKCDAFAWSEKFYSYFQLSYDSFLPLDDYLEDLAKRVSFFKDWSSDETKIPNKFWLGGFFFPQSFLTSILMDFARKDTIRFKINPIIIQFVDFLEFLNISSFEHRASTNHVIRN